jgi:hypothetical protein
MSTTPRAKRHPIDLACGVALTLVVAIDFFTAESLSLVAYVQPQLVGWVQFVEQGLSWIALLNVATVLATWPLLFREQHRRMTLVVIALQTIGLVLDVTSLVTSTLFGKQAAALYLLLEAACVLTSTVTRRLMPEYDMGRSVAGGGGLVGSGAAAVNLVPEPASLWLPRPWRTHEARAPGRPCPGPPRRRSPPGRRLRRSCSR